MNELKHYGVKGMHWGVRRYQNYDGTRIGAKRRGSGGGFWDDAKKTGTKKSVVVKSVRKGTNDKPLGKKIDKKKAKKVVVEAVEKGTNDKTLGQKAKELNNERLRRASEAASKDAKNLREHGYTKEAEAVQKVADKNRLKYEEKAAEYAENKMKSKDYSNKSSEEVMNDWFEFKKEFKNSSSASISKAVKKASTRDEKKFTPQQKRTSRDAKKDAEEFARAKAFYGEGAGNRRKAIKLTVESKKKKDPFYSEEFEYHLSQQDMEYHMKKAKAERSRKDTYKGVKSTTRKLERGMQFASRFL